MADDPTVLLTSDGGVDASGIATLRTELTAFGDVAVVEPEPDRSGVDRARGDRRDAGREMTVPVRPVTVREGA